MAKKRQRCEKCNNDAKSRIEVIAIASAPLAPATRSKTDVLFNKKMGIYLFRLMIHCPFMSLTVSLCQMAALLGPSWKSRQPRMCQYCQRMFSNKFNLKQHILNMHTVGRELACEICQKKVKNKWYLRRHHVTHHGAPLKK